MDGDVLRLLLSQLPPQVLRRARCVSRPWARAADARCLWQSHLRQHADAVESRGEQGGCALGDGHAQIASGLSAGTPEQIAALDKCSLDPSLVSLDVSHTHLEDLSFLSEMPQLQELNISCCRHLVEISALTCCTNLRSVLLLQARCMPPG